MLWYSTVIAVGLSGARLERGSLRGWGLRHRKAGRSDTYAHWPDNRLGRDLRT